MSAGADVTPAPPRSGLHRAALGAALALALVAGGLAWHWWRHPSVFEQAGVSLVIAPEVGDDPVAVMVTFPGSGETVVVDSARPRTSPGSVPLGARTLVCTRRAPADGGPEDAGIGYQDAARLATYCSRVRTVPREGGLRMDLATDYFVVVVAPPRAGRARVPGLDVSYHRGLRHGLQRGTQLVGLGFTADVRR